MASPHEEDKNILVVRGEPDENGVQDVELLELIAQRFKLQTMRFTGPEYAEFILKAADVEPDQPYAADSTSKPAPKVSEIQRREDFLVRETFDEFRRIWKPKELPQTVGRAFNDLVDVRPSRERQVWEGNRWVDTGEPRPRPGIVVKTRAELGIEPFRPSNSMNLRSLRLASVLAIEAGSLIDVMSSGGLRPTESTEAARELISGLTWQIVTQIDAQGVGERS